MDDLLAEFVAETREMLEAIEGEIVAWEADPGDRARLDSIFRFVHTVKGNCGFFDFPQLESLSHAAESALAEVRAGRRSADVQLVNGVLAIIDRIGQLTDQIEGGETLTTSGDDMLIAMLDNAGAETSEPQEIQAVEAFSARSNTPSSTPRSIRLPVELLDRVMSGVSDMVLARNDLARRLRASGSEPTIDGPFERLIAHFDETSGGWQASRKLQRMIRYRIGNLLDPLDEIQRHDLVLCRNVILYFDELTRERAFKRVSQNMAQDGLLMLGAGETTVGRTGAFIPARGMQGLYTKAAPEPISSRWQKRSAKTSADNVPAAAGARQSSR